MKMSNVFTLPVQPSSLAYSIISGDHVQAEAAKHAINQHDNMVEILTNLTHSAGVFAEVGECDFCGSLEGHRVGCDYQDAVELLEQLNDD